MQCVHSVPHDLSFIHRLLLFIRKTHCCLAYGRHESKISVKGCGMGSWLVLVSPCLREIVVATCKIGSFLCSLDNLPQKNVIVLFFGNQISKWCSFEKRAIFDLLFTFSSHVFCSPY